jgi:uncharacterized protein
VLGKLLGVGASAFLMTAYTYAAPVENDCNPVGGTFAGGAAQGMFSVMGEAIVETVRREYPGSSFLYEPGNNAGSLRRMLDGEVPVAILGPGEGMAAVTGAPPFSKSYPKENIGVIARVHEGIVGYVIARKDFADKYGVRTLADIKEKRLPIRYSTNQLGNVSTVAHGRSVLGAYGLTESFIKEWGGHDYHVPDNSGFELLKDGKADLVITAGIHPDARIVALARGTPVVLLSISDKVEEIARDYGTEIAAIPPGTYDFQEGEYRGVTMPLYIAALAPTNHLTAYKVAKSLYNHFGSYQGAHAALRTLHPDILPKASPWTLHSGAGQFYREAGLLP